MTLIELMVTIAIIVLMVGVGTIGISSIRGADVGTTANVLSGAMRYVASLAVSYNKTHRLIIDMDNRRYWTEAADEDDPCSRFLPDDADPPQPKDEAEKPKSDDEVEVPKARFAQDDSELLSGDFQPETNVTAILTAHHEVPQVEGKVAIYFYPTGYTERAMIWVGERVEDERGDAMWEPAITLELHALGRITRYGKVIDVRSVDELSKEDR